MNILREQMEHQWIKILPKTLRNIVKKHFRLKLTLQTELILLCQDYQWAQTIHKVLWHHKARMLTFYKKQHTDVL